MSAPLVPLPSYAARRAHLSDSLSWLSWTRRGAGVKVKLTVQDDVYSGTVLEQAVVIEYVIINVQVSLAFVPNLPAP